jgi:hypothetical protein
MREIFVLEKKDTRVTGLSRKISARMAEKENGKAVSYSKNYLFAG